jgi:RND family efflux transporter MFP subunit
VSEHPVLNADAAPPSPRQRRRPRLFGLAAAAVAVATVANGVLQRQDHAATVARWTQAQAIPTVAVVTPKQGEAGWHLVLPGDVQAWYEAPIYARVTGYLKSWNFDYGGHVKKDQVLAEITAPDLDAQLAAAKAKLNSANALVKVREAEAQFAKTTYVRWRDSPKGVVSEQEKDEKEAVYRSAVAQLNAANADVNVDQGDVDRLAALEGFKQITAPFDGVVTARETDVGALINAGSGTGGGNGPAPFKVADLHKVRVYVGVPQRMAAGIRPGLTAELDLPQYPGRIFKAVVATTSHAIDPKSRALLVELQADNPQDLLQPGAFAEVAFDLPADPDVVHIPTSALLFRQHGLKVATLGPNDRVILKAVTLGRNLGTEVEVLGGLSAADRVINSPPDSLGDGDPVRVAQGGPRERATEGGSAVTS